MFYRLPFSLVSMDAARGGSAGRLQTTATTLTGASGKKQKGRWQKHRDSRERRRIRKKGKGGELLDKRAQNLVFEIKDH